MDPGSMSASAPMSVRDRVLAVLRGEKPDRLPFIDRIDVWYACHERNGTLPAEFAGKSATEIHRAIGMGQQKFVVPYRLRLRGVEVIARFNGQVFFHEAEPCLEFFCGMFDYLDTTQAGVTQTELITPVGRLRVQHELLPDNVATGTEHYIREHFIKEDADYKAVEYLIEHAEFVPRLEKVAELEATLGDIGYVVPMVPRVPFQQVLLEYLGEVALFYALSDSPARVERLMTVLDEQLTEVLARLADLAVAYVEFPDNLHGLMTNPRLFARYSLAAYQRHCQTLHDQGKKVGSHTDGNVKPLLSLLAESGLDVCESFSPHPLTPCTFDEAWRAWRGGGPIIWGGIPSPILEERTSQADFQGYVHRLLETVGDGPIILGVGDLVMGHNSIERVREIADLVEGHPIG
jgi:hypothetical protein